MDDLDRKPSNPAPASGFEFNNPTVISLLYLASWVTGGLTGIIGVVLAFVWRSEPKADWEISHYQYHINSFWIALAGTVAGVLLMIVLVGFLLMAAVAILVIVRSVLALVNAQKHQPMQAPGSWTV
ncbi:MAG: hypothetical protein P8Y58_05230, partial [Novosphingobium sp.]